MCWRVFCSGTLINYLQPCMGSRQIQRKYGWAEVIARTEVTAFLSRVDISRNEKLDTGKASDISSVGLGLTH